MELQNRKIVILGAGHVGSHAGYSLIAQGLAEEIVYIDIDQRKAEAQALDLFDATSTTLDSAHLRRAIAEATGVDQKSISAYALGEHGESQMVPWSAVTIGGKSLTKLRAERPDTYGKLNLQAIANRGKEAGWTILGGKGSTEFGIASSIAQVVRAIFHDENRILPVSVLLDGQYGQHDVYASVPAVLNRNGVEDIIELDLTPEEQAQFDRSCQTMKENYQLALTL